MSDPQGLVHLLCEPNILSLKQARDKITRKSKLQVG